MNIRSIPYLDMNFSNTVLWITICDSHDGKRFSIVEKKRANRGCTAPTLLQHVSTI